jgi:hypothetical protein
MYSRNILPIEALSKVVIRLRLPNSSREAFVYLYIIETCLPPSQVDIDSCSSHSVKLA